MNWQNLFSVDATIFGFLSLIFLCAWGEAKNKTPMRRLFFVFFILTVITGSLAAGLS